MKATGAEIKQFWDEWPPGADWYNDDAPLEVYLCSDNGDKLLLKLDAKYDLSDFGLLCWQGGSGKKVPKDPPMRGCLDVSFESWFKFWKKNKTTTSFSVLVNNNEVDAFKAIMKDHGWKVS
jgi:hypothetical protein